MIRAKGIKIRLADPAKLNFGVQQLITNWLLDVYKACRRRGFMGKDYSGKQLPALKPGYLKYKKNYAKRQGLPTAEKRESLTGHMWDPKNAAVSVKIRRRMVVGEVKFRGAKVFRRYGGSKGRMKHGRPVQPAQAKARELERRYNTLILGATKQEVESFNKELLKKYAKAMNNATFYFERTIGES